MLPVCSITHLPGLYPRSVRPALPNVTLLQTQALVQ
jgi:hypothetical protein